jgi:hypothetical protein
MRVFGHRQVFCPNFCVCFFVEKIAALALCVHQCPEFFDATVPTIIGLSAPFKTVRSAFRHRDRQPAQWLSMKANWKWTSLAPSAKHMSGRDLGRQDPPFATLPGNFRVEEIALYALTLASKT